MRIVAFLFLVNLTIAAIFEISFCNGNQDVICMESEKLALSRFKQDLKDPSSRLSSWDVEDDCYYNWISVPDLEWLHGLSHLEHLDLSGVYLRKTPNWVQVINKLPSLVELHLSNCGLDYIPSLFDVYSTSLAILDLSFNQFGSLIPRWIFSLTSLVSLDLSSSNFTGPIPEGSWNNFSHDP
ncbi:hypothetical protein ACSBR1_000377 [Camellia fascicularis]